MKIKIAVYERKADPCQLMTAFDIAMGRAHFTKEEEDAGYCQLFVEHLGGAALTWFSRFDENFIDSFQQLSTVFFKYYSMFMQKGASNANLWTISQGSKEPLQAFMDRFIAIISRNVVADETVIAALRNALWY